MYINFQKEFNDHLKTASNQRKYVIMIEEELKLMGDLLCYHLPHIQQTVLKVLGGNAELLHFEPNRLIYVAVVRILRRGGLTTLLELDKEYRNLIYPALKGPFKQYCDMIDPYDPDEMLEYMMQIDMQEPRTNTLIVEDAALAHIQHLITFRIGICQSQKSRLMLDLGLDSDSATGAINNLINKFKSMLPNKLDNNESLAISVRQNLFTRPPVIRTHLAEHDELLGGGFKKGCFYIYAGRPGMGKTAVALKFLSSRDCLGTKSIFFSLEMPNSQLVQRLACSISGVSNSNLNKLAHEWDQREFDRFDRALDDIANADHLQFIDTPMTLEKIYSACEHHRASSGVPLGLIIVDYLQLVREPSKANFREQEIAEISRGLKNLAKQFDCAVIALAQLNRDVEGRAVKRPMASDLRESGSLEQDADVITMLYRDSKYNEIADRDKIELIVVKNRHGQDGKTEHRFIGETFSINDL